MSPISPEVLKEDIEEIKREIRSMSKTLSAIAVQDERIRHVEAGIEAVWRKHDDLQQRVDTVSRWQASCPREQFHAQFKWVWVVLVPQGLMMIGFVIALIEVARKVAG